MTKLYLSVNSAPKAKLKNLQEIFWGINDMVH